MIGWPGQINPVQAMTRQRVWIGVLWAAGWSWGWNSEGLLLFAQESRPFQELARSADEARRSQRKEQALQLYRRALEVEERWPEGWWYLGILHYEMGRYGKAGEAFSRLVRLEPSSGIARALLGFCQFRTEDYEAALESLLQSRRLGIAENEEIRLLAEYHSALLLIRAGRFEEASALLLSLASGREDRMEVVEALGLAALAWPLLPSELAPQQRELVARSGEGVLYTATRQLEKARGLYADLLARYPGEPNVHYNHGIFLLLEDSEQALAAFRRALDLWPDHVSARLQIALEYTRRQDFAAALPYAEEAAHKAPGSPAARRILGRLWLQLGNLPAALQELEAAATLSPDEAEVFYLLARAYTLAGQEEKAGQAREKFRSLTPASSSSVSP